jgi:hypothetical protein
MTGDALHALCANVSHVAILRRTPPTNAMHHAGVRSAIDATRLQQLSL